MTDRDQGTGPSQAPPPARPTFEFRERPSAAAARRPSVVGVAHVLWLAAAGAGLLAAVLTLLSLGELNAAVLAVLERDFPNETPATRDRVVTIAGAVLVGGGVLIALAQAGFATGMRSGRGGARIALVFLATLSVVDMLLSAGVLTALGRIALLLSVALAAVGSVVMFLSGANRWFAARRH